jgi:hypothetical protein
LNGDSASLIEAPVRRSASADLSDWTHGQYFALSGSTQRTPPRGSALSPA